MAKWGDKNVEDKKKMPKATKILCEGKCILSSLKISRRQICNSMQ